MKTARLLLAMLTVLSIFAIHSVTYAAEVSQGICKSFNQQEKQLVIEEYDTHFTEGQKYGGATGIINIYDVSKAKVGMHPEPGDIVRIAYKVEGDKRSAIKVMNVSKQDLMKK
ncbi:hypothetical protein LN040_09665 [Desulfovibrio subterraneus]|jgi:hypothetical protein|uniref:DUF5666 domain-containing protein n=1 Tax=Desulfovibrio subterraneus TaxID=2718620 RepID=A0A7J0BPM9_9BACT|nr:hypothetical protein [Desulfovibrio subterraneus]WBF66001.1 hypothetical protein LN040_09665 [Desulfovibrio subterraneus]GFM35162.1 hypothetical protein DSM101010T_35270 [Desulfovibrio subterraneus]